MSNISKNTKKSVIKGKWWDININIKNKINAKYDKIKDWKMDPNGYFLIHVNKKLNLIEVGYCKLIKESHELEAMIYGENAIDIINTLIKNKFISTLQHAGDMGIELHKAEIALKNNIKYVQDKDLVLNY